jgi:hypothetical protein
MHRCHNSFARRSALIVLLLVAGAVLMNLPEFRRYLRMSRM